jgi:uncharacterized protein (UPF0303 family)
MTLVEQAIALDRAAEVEMRQRQARVIDETFDQQANRTTLPAFNAEVARKLGEIAVNIASRRSLPVAVSVAQPQGAIYFCALEGSCADNAEWIRRKQNTVFHFGKSSLEVGAMFAHEGRSLASHGLLPNDYTLFGGGVPLRVSNAGIVGVMSVSGLDDVSDHELVIEALCWHLGIPHFDAVFSRSSLAGGEMGVEAHVVR